MKAAEDYAAEKEAAVKKAAEDAATAKKEAAQARTDDFGGYANVYAAKSR